MQKCGNVKNENGKTFELSSLVGGGMQEFHTGFIVCSYRVKDMSAVLRDSKHEEYVAV